MEIIRQALDAVTNARNLLSGYITVLNDEERISLPKMGEKSLSFVEKTGELSALNPQLCPPFFDPEGFRIDLEDAVNLRGLANVLKQFSQEVSDTMMCAGSEAYTQSLMNYATFGTAAKNKIPGAEALYEELKKRFPKNQGRKGAAADADAPAE
jgi:hypothetical protein